MALLRAVLLALSIVLAAPAAASAISFTGATTVTNDSADQVLAAGDTFALAVTLTNSSGTAVTGVGATLTATTPGVTVLDGDAPFSDAADGATTSNAASPFSVYIGTGLTCGADLAFVLRVTANGASTDVPLVVATGAAGPLRRTDAADVPRTIPDNSSIVSSVEVAGAGLVKDVEVNIGRIDHSYVGDLRLRLEAPDGTTVLLVDGRGGAQDNFVNTTFASDGGLGSITSAAAPFTGRFVPEDDLTRLYGRQQQGTWKLHVTDRRLVDTGTLVSWGLSLGRAVCDGNPIPTFTATPDPVASGANVTLDASGSLDPSQGGSIVRYEWDLDGNGTFETDGTTSPTRVTSWTGDRAVQVGLRVTDNQNISETVRIPVYVTTPPVAAFTHAPATPVSGQTVTFDATPSSDADGPVASYAWDLDGNGSFEGSGATTTTSFATPGSRTVRLRVTDAVGATDVEIVTITVLNRAPVARLVVPSPSLTGQQIAFSAATSSDPDGTITGYEWDLDGDGTFETNTGPGSTTARSFASAGDYVVGVRVTDDAGATAATTAAVPVRAAPLPPETPSTATSPPSAGGSATLPAAGSATGATGAPTSVAGPGGAGAGADVPGGGSALAFTAALVGPPIQAMRLARTRGLSISCRVSAGARCSLTVYLPAAAARRLKLLPRAGSRPRVIGRTSVLATGAQETQARIVLSGPMRRALRGARSTRVVIRGAAADALGRVVPLVRVVLLRG